MSAKKNDDAHSAAVFLPKTRTILALAEAAAHCHGCELYKRATQTVFGEGSPHASLVLVGEQPGDVEDRAGHPFAGPAGGLLNKALEEARLSRRAIYVTNAVKHFKWEPQGKKRKHKRPSSREVAACRPWLEAEIEAIKPAMVVCLGVTAAQAMLGRTVRLNVDGGKLHTNERGLPIFVTMHPSSVLRYPDKEERAAQYDRLVEHFKQVRRNLLRLRKAD